MNIIDVISDWGVFIISDKNGVGIRSTISISNTIKMIANMKNRSENGTRALFLGSNPHSNGDVFSRSDVDRLFRTLANINSKIVINSATMDVIIGMYIIWNFFISIKLITILVSNIRTYINSYVHIATWKYKYIFFWLKVKCLYKLPKLDTGGLILN